MNLNNLLDRPIAFHRCFVTITGSVTASVMLSQAVYWSNRGALPDGWFWKTQDEWFDETGLSRREQETARKNLKSLGVLSEKLVGVPAKMHYKINHDVLSDLLKNIPGKEPKYASNKDAIKYGGNVQTGMAETYKQDSTKRTNWNGGNVQTITENTNRDYTETTSNKKISAKAQSSPKENPLHLLLDAGINEELAKEFIQLRKSKKALITKTVINGISKEAQKAGITLSDAIAQCIVRNWQSFKAEWVSDIKNMTFEERDIERRRKRDEAARSNDFGEGLDDDGFPIPGYIKDSINGVFSHV